LITDEVAVAIVSVREIDRQILVGHAGRQEDRHEQESAPEAQIRIDERHAENEDGLNQEQERVHVRAKSLPY